MRSRVVLTVLAHTDLISFRTTWTGRGRRSSTCSATVSRAGWAPSRTTSPTPSTSIGRTRRFLQRQVRVNRSSREIKRPCLDVFSLLDVRPKPKTEPSWLVANRAAARAALKGIATSRATTPTTPPKPTEEPAPETDANAPKTTASTAAPKDAPAAASSSPPPGA